MSLNDTPSGERLHIGFFGRRNAGKSSLVNAVTGQELSVVSEVRGTTTDPVRKAMELLPIGPVLIIDTPGFDDEGGLGELRVKKTRQVLNRTDLAILVVDSVAGMTECDRQLLSLIQEKKLPYLIVWNKCDLLAEPRPLGEHEIAVSAVTRYQIQELKDRIAALAVLDTAPPLVQDLLPPNVLAVLVIPIDSAAPKGRLILPQQQVLRDLLDGGCTGLCVRDTELATTLERLSPTPPELVITDSQAFAAVAAVTPESIPMTSFSILMARRKGLLEEAVRGIAAVEKLKDGDRVLIAEGCTHHRQCDDIGTVKLPRWLHQNTGKNLEIVTSSGNSFPEDLSQFALIIHCGGCMLNSREVGYRMKAAREQGVPITNYGIAIAYMKGILRRSLSLFPKILALLDEQTEGGTE